MTDTISTRIAARLTGESYSVPVVEDLTKTVYDRLCLKAGITNDSAFPSLFDSIVVDATVKCWRRHYYEGIESEGIGGNTVKFVDDVLEEYEDEIDAWLAAHAGEEGVEGGKWVRFI